MQDGGSSAFIARLAGDSSVKMSIKYAVQGVGSTCAPLVVTQLVRLPRWSFIFLFPLGFSIVSFFGVIVSSSSQAIYGEAIWSPIDLLNRFLDGSPSHATRFGVWFISASFIIAQVSLN